MDNFILDDTITTNITFNFSDEFVNFSKLDQVSKTKIDEFITNLPDKYINLGTRQIFVWWSKTKNSNFTFIIFTKRLLILEESTNALDSTLEKEILEAISDLKNDHLTVIMISHSKNNLIFGDKKFRINKGKISLFIINEKIVTVLTWICWFSNSHCNCFIKNYFVYGLEKSEESIRRIQFLNNSKFPFETNDTKLKKTLNFINNKKKNFLCITDDSILEKSDYILLNINFDIIKSNNKITFDLKPFKKTINQIGSKIRENSLLIVNSTIPPGTCENIILPIIKTQFKKRRLNDSKIFIAHSYERVMPGKDYFDSITNYWRVYSGINLESQKCYNFLKVS